MKKSHVRLSILTMLLLAVRLCPAQTNHPDFILKK